MGYYTKKGLLEVRRKYWLREIEYTEDRPDKTYTESCREILGRVLAALELEGVGA